MHSPVWQDYDPSFDTAEIWSDWEYYSDDYYDDDTPRKRQKINRAENGVDGSGDVGSGIPRKRRQLCSTDDIPELSLGGPLQSELENPRNLAPVIVWRSKTEADHVPVLSEGQDEKIALLKDWRERFKIPFQPGSNSLHTSGVARRRSQNAVAVVIKHNGSGKGTKEKDPITNTSQNSQILSKGEVAQTCTSGAANTASSLAEQWQKVSETLKPVSVQKAPSGRAVLTKLENKVPVNGLKRKISTVTGNDASSESLNGASTGRNGSKCDTAYHKQRLAREDLLGDSATSERARKRGRPKAESSIPAIIPTAKKDYKNGPSREETPSGSTTFEVVKKMGGPRKVDGSVPTATSRANFGGTTAEDPEAMAVEPRTNGHTGTKRAGITGANTGKTPHPEGAQGSLRKRKAPGLPNGNGEPAFKRTAQGLQQGDAEPTSKRTASRPRGRPPGRVTK